MIWPAWLKKGTLLTPCSVGSWLIRASSRSIASHTSTVLYPEAFWIQKAMAGSPFSRRP